ncbi:L-2-amino-thiazoline-4-carboxylic acid hydrolase [Chryseolinea sp. T2]|uniref:L-2-amino-thiazoline-4-carboxylic acid hydrolase n=1 Tax=Chryseolinea sp. T2 TaxID=3129255 RepID=UPI003076C7BC
MDRPGKDNFAEGYLLKRSYKKYFLRAIQRNYPDAYPAIAAETEKNYRSISVDTQFSFHSANPLDRRLDFCACFLALIKKLDERNEPFDVIRNVSLEVVMDYVAPKNAIQRSLKRLPAKLIGTRLWNVLIKSLAVRLGKNDNREGFIATIITAKKETYGLGYGVDIIECGVCKLFNKHAFGKYTSILCEVDKLTSEFAGLELIRTSTIANGAAKCDFRYRKSAR